MRHGTSGAPPRDGARAATVTARDVERQIGPVGEPAEANDWKLAWRPVSHGHATGWQRNRDQGRWPRTGGARH